MKKIITLFSISLIANYCIGQDTLSNTSKWNSNNIIKTDLVGYFRSLTIFSYERVVSESWSIMVTYGQGKYTVTGQNAEDNLLDKTGRSFPCTQDITLKSYISIQPRYYLSHEHNKIPAGFHIGPSINFTSGSEVFTSTGDVHGNSTNYGTETVSTEFHSTSFLINIGPQILIKRIVALDLSVGLGFGNTSGTESTVYGTSQQYGSTSDFSYGSFVAAFSASLGFAFGK